MKYASGLYLPTLVVLAVITALPAPRHPRARPRCDAGRGHAGPAGIGYFFSGPLGGISSTTTDRAKGTDTAATMLAAQRGVGRAGLPGRARRLDRAMCCAHGWARCRGSASRDLGHAGGAIALGLVLTGTALLAPAYQIHLQTEISLYKHVGFGSALRRADGRPRHGPAGRPALPASTARDPAVRPDAGVRHGAGPAGVQLPGLHADDRVPAQRSSTARAPTSPRSRRSPPTTCGTRPTGPSGRTPTSWTTAARTASSTPAPTPSGSGPRRKVRRDRDARRRSARRRTSGEGGVAGNSHYRLAAVFPLHHEQRRGRLPDLGEAMSLDASAPYGGGYPDAQGGHDPYAGQGAYAGLVSGGYADPGQQGPYADPAQGAYAAPGQYADPGQYTDPGQYADQGAYAAARAAAGAGRRARHAGSGRPGAVRGRARRGRARGLRRAAGSPLP